MWLKQSDPRGGDGGGRRELLEDFREGEDQNH